MQVNQARAQYVRWLFATRDLSPHTVRAYDGDVAALERYLGVLASVAEIDRDRLVEFIEKQRAAGLSSTSIQRRACGVRGFCRWLVSSGALDLDPWAGTAVAAGRARRLPRIVPTHEELVVSDADVIGRLMRR
ncbi:MAG: integrase/recombinase XerC [Nocardioidaceae bacterium]|jgi:integrase/recombinase XerC|nr:integrase/recombinase XerC [Nocardioidaceae bacterium]